MQPSRKLRLTSNRYRSGAPQAQEEADRIRREAEQREQARLAEEKRKADEQARREADVKHRKAVGTGNRQKLFWPIPALLGIRAIEVLTAVKDGRIPIPVSVTEVLMNAYRAYDAIEERKWAEQSLTEEKQKSGLTIGQKRSLTAFRKILTRHCASLHRPWRFHMKASVAIRLSRYTTICAQQ